MPDTLQDKVNRALENSKQNGFDPTVPNPFFTACDLAKYDADLEHEDLDQIQDCVVQWLAKKGVQ